MAEPPVESQGDARHEMPRHEGARADHRKTIGKMVVLWGFMGFDGILWDITMIYPLVGGLEHDFDFSIYWEFYHPN